MATHPLLGFVRWWRGSVQVEKHAALDVVGGLRPSADGAFRTVFRRDAGA
jgi:hypothetical protein